MSRHIGCYLELIAALMASPLDAALDAQELVNDQLGLLELIDKLQFAQLDNVKLPQIVVVGDRTYSGATPFVIPMPEQQIIMHAKAERNPSCTP